VIAVRRHLCSAGLGLVGGLVLVVLAADSSALVSPFVPDAEIVSDAHGALKELAVHYRRDFHDESFETLADLISALPGDVTVRVLVAERSQFDFLVQELARAGVCDEARLRPLVTGMEISPWAKDRFGTLERRGRPVVAVPPHRAIVGGARGNDEKVPDLLCAELDHVTCQSLPFYFEGGDLIADDDHVFVAATLLERNKPLTEARRGDLLEQLHDELGRDVVSIGRDGSDVPDHHIGMYLTPLGDGVVAVASPRLGHRLYRALPASEQILDLDEDPAELARFDRVAMDLRSQGLEVVEVPLLLTSTPRVYVSYNNALLERRDGVGRVYMPVYGIAALDDAAAGVYRENGWLVERVRVGEVYGHAGSLRCLVGVVSRV